MTTAAEATYGTLVQDLYVTYFGRPADYFGLQNFSAALQAANAPTTLAGLNAAYSTSSAVAALINSFGTSPESQTLYGSVASNSQSASNFVAAIYQNLFNRAPDVAGLSFWTNAIVGGSLTPGDAALSIAAAAQAAAGTNTQSQTDAASFANKVTVAGSFTAALSANSNNSTDITAYSGTEAAALARQLLNGVTGTMTAAQVAAVNVNSTIAEIASVPQGSAVYLTTGVDNLSGSNFQAIVDGTVSSTDTTLNALDTLTGTAANNVLTIQVEGSPTTLPNATLNNVQTVDIKASTGFTFNFAAGSGYSGVTTVDVVGSDGADSLTVGSGVTAIVNDTAGTVTLAGGATQTVTTAGGVVLSGAAGAVTAVDTNQGAANSTINGGTNVSLTSTGSTGGTITIGGTTAPTGTITVVDNLVESTTAPANVTGGTIAVTGGTTVSITEVATPYTSTTGGATNYTVTEGAVTVTGGKATTTVTVAESASVAAAPTVLAGTATGDANVVTFTALAAGATATVDGLTFKATAAMTAAQVAAAFANLGVSTTQGGSTLGTYSGADSGNYTSGAVGGTSTAPTVTFTSKAPEGAAITASGGAAETSYTAGTASATASGQGGVTAGAVSITDVNYSTANANTIATVSLTGTDHGATVSSSALSSLSLTNIVGPTTAVPNVTVNNKTATALTLTLNNIDAAINLDGGTAGTYKTLTLTTAGTTGSMVDITATGVTALTVNGKEQVALNSTGYGNSTFTALKTIAVSGSAGVIVNVSGDTNFTDFNASGTTGSNTVTLNAANATFEGGSGGDTLTLSTTTDTKTITFGSGNDTLILASGTTAVAGTITGGGGTNTLEMVAADAVTASASSVFASHVTGFQVLDLTGGTSAQTVAINTLGGFNTVVTGGEATGGVLTLSGFTTGGTLELTSSAAGTGAYVVTNSAWTSSAPAASFNVELSSHGSTALTAGTVTASDVTAISISATDTNAKDAAGTITDTLTLVDTSATSITVTGNAHLTLTTTGNTDVSTINASAMTAGITVQAAGTVAETITGGAGGHNVLTASSGSLGDTLIGGAGGHDTFVANAGLDILTGKGVDNTYVVTTASENVNSYADITNIQAGDTIQIGASATSFGAAAISLASTAVFQDYANAAIHNTTTGGVSWFQFGGNTYIVENESAGTSFVNGTDHIVELTGTVSLTTASLNTAHGTLLVG